MYVHLSVSAWLFVSVWCPCSENMHVQTINKIVLKSVTHVLISESLQMLSYFQAT